PTAAEGSQSRGQSCGNCSKACHPKAESMQRFYPTPLTQLAQNRPCASGKSIVYPKSRHYIFGEEARGSGGVRERRQLAFGEPHARGQDDAETVEKGGLSRIGLCDASQTDLPVRGGRQHNVVRLNAGELLQDGPRRITETCALL